MELHRPRQWGACWLAATLYEQLGHDQFWADRLPASREGTRWDHVLQTLVSYRLIDPGSEWRLHRPWFERSAMGDILGEDFRLVEKSALYAASTRCWSTRRRCLIICAGAGRICSACSLTFCRTI
jgi:hypothetical protein